MNIVILNGSPKKRRSGSRFFSTILRVMLLGHKVTRYAVRNQEAAVMLAAMRGADAVILAVPLYVDGIPSHLLSFLGEAERFCVHNACRFKFYVISNSGFVPGRNNEAHLDQYKCWCERCGVVYAGGLGIGGGVMLHALFFVGLFLGAGGFILQALIKRVSGGAFVFDKCIIPFAYRIGIWLFFSLGMLMGEYRLARAIKKRKAVKNRYTAVMVPAWVFLVFSDMFMVIAALCKGAPVFSLFKKET